MKKTIIQFVIILLLSANIQAQQFNVLVFTKAKGFKHGVTPTAVDALWKLSRKHHFNMHTTDNSNVFTLENLSAYQAIVFVNTSGDILNKEQQEAFKGYIQNGGGFVGIHGATTAEYDWNWYGRFIGRYFIGHPKKQSAIIHVKDPNFPATCHLPTKWLWTDEWYEFTELQSDSIHVLLTVDEDTYNPVFTKKGQTYSGMQPEHPIAWYQYVDGGRMFYTSLGHLEHAWDDHNFMQHVYGGLWWAATASKLSGGVK